MARLYSNEDLPLSVVERFRALGHDVLTVQEAPGQDRTSERKEGGIHTLDAAREVTGLIGSDFAIGLLCGLGVALGAPLVDEMRLDETDAPAGGRARSDLGAVGQDAGRGRLTRHTRYHLPRPLGRVVLA